VLKKILLTSVLVSGWTLLSFAAATTVTVSGRQMLVNGQPYVVRGVAYSAVPVGYSSAGTSAGCIGGYVWWNDRPAYVADFPLIARMGANTIRTYAILNDTSASTVLKVRSALDEAQRNGLYVIMNYYPSHFVSVAANQATWQSEFLAGVNAYKDHPAVLMWEFGNEQNLDNGQDALWYPLVNQVAGAAKAADPNHPVMVVDAECPQCNGGSGIYINAGSVARSADDASMPNLDIWGINVYRGPGFYGLFDVLLGSTSKPILVTEFGKDAYRDATGQEDQDIQDASLRSQWLEIANHLSANDANKALSGGVIFQWSDEWWKGSGTSCQTQDASSLFSRATDTTDPIYNEEWLGLTSVRPIDAISNPSGTSRTLRKSYTSMQSFWNPGATGISGSGSGLLDGTVRNYPNPFRSGTENTKFVVLLNAAASVDIRIYDAGGQFVASLNGTSSGSGRLELSWNGRNRHGDIVSAGLYIARIEAKSGGREETQYRRVVAVK